MNLQACLTLLGDMTVRGTVLGFVIGVGLLLCRKRSAAFRCGWLTIGMLGLIALPFAWCLPRVEVAFLPTLGQAAPELASASLEATGPAFPFGTAIIAIWFAGIVVLAATQSIGMWQLQRWRDRSERLQSGYWNGLVEDVSHALGYRGQVHLYACPGMHSPAAAGIFRPCVFLPEEASQWDLDRLRVVLLHEIGHLKRRDLWTQWLSQTACALYWFHPMVWMLHRRLHQTREFACDHTVLSTGTEPSHYAQHLLALARNLSQRPAGPRLAMANGLFLAMAADTTRQCALERRVRAILSFQSSARWSAVLMALWSVVGLSTALATATVTPVREAAAPIAIPSPIRHEQIAPEAMDGPAIPPAEIHWRLTADPFPGN